MYTNTNKYLNIYQNNVRENKKKSWVPIHMSNLYIHYISPHI